MNPAERLICFLIFRELERELKMCQFTCNFGEKLSLGSKLYVLIVLFKSASEEAWDCLNYRSFLGAVLA